MKQDSKYTYKVEHLPTSTAHYTHDKQEAYDTYQKFRSDFRDGIRIYEAPMPINDHDEIEWEVIEHYDEDEEDTPVMSNTVDKHTPGPWEAIKQGGSILAPFMIRSGKICVANLIWGISSILPETYEEVEANAALIASAPQLKKENEELKERNRVLVEALKKLYNAVDSCVELTPELLSEANKIIQSNQ